MTHIILCHKMITKYQDEDSKNSKQCILF